MPTAKVHNPACAILAVAALTLPLVTPLTPWDAAQVSAGCALGVIVTPDLDLVNPLAKVPVVGWLYGALWFVYRKVLKHREYASHMPGVGTVARAILIFPLWWVLWVIGVRPWWIILGMIAADFIHLFLDAFWRS